MGLVMLIWREESGEEEGGVREGRGRKREESGKEEGGVRGGRGRSQGRKREESGKIKQRLRCQVEQL